MTDFLRDAYSIMGLLLPLTGERATGNVLLKATGDDVVITATRPRYLYPIVGGAVAPERVYKTVGDVTITSAGTAVPVRSLVGGAMHNIAEATPMRLVEGLNGNEDGLEVDLAVTLVQAGGLAGGTTPEAFGTFKRVALHEELTAAEVSQQLFIAGVGHFPALLLTWDSAGETELSIRHQRHMPCRWSAFIIVSRNDSGPRRRAEGLRLMNDVAEIITDRCETEDREVFSTPHRIVVNGMGRVVRTPTVFVYAVSFTTETTLVKREWRTFPRMERVAITMNTTTTPPVTIVNDAQTTIP